MPCERKHIEAIRAWADGLIHAAQTEIEKHPGDNASAANALFYWADGPEQRAALAALAALAACDESPWRSMESAPKDGTPIIVRTRFGYTGFSKYDGSDWVALEERATYYTEDALDGWMPKPEIAPLPAATEGKP